MDNFKTLSNIKPTIGTDYPSTVDSEADDTSKLSPFDKIDYLVRCVYSYEYLARQGKLSKPHIDALKAARAAVQQVENTLI
jgi:hypothetical protein